MNCCGRCDNLVSGCTCDPPEAPPTVRSVQVAAVAHPPAEPVPVVPPPTVPRPRAFAGTASLQDGRDCLFCYRRVPAFYVSIGGRGEFAICLDCAGKAVVALLKTMDKPNQPRGVA